MSSLMLFKQYLHESETKIIIRELSDSDIKQYLSRYKNAMTLITMNDLKIHEVLGYGVFSNDEIVGVILYTENPKQYTKGIKVDCKILFYYLKKEYRGFGYGKKMISNVVKKYDSIFLTTDNQSTEMAKHIYTKMGFKVVSRSGEFVHWIKGTIDNIYMVSGLVLGCISSRSSQDKLQMDKYKLKYTEVLKNDPWRGIVESKEPLNKIEVENLLHDHEYDPDNKKIPYYFIVKNIEEKKEFVIFTDKDIWYPLNTMSEKIKARDAGLKKGIPLHQVNWPEGIS